MNREFRTVPEGIVVTETKQGFFKNKVNEVYYKPIPKTYYTREKGGHNIVWVNVETGVEILVENPLYVPLGNLWALEGHKTKLGPKV